MRMNPFIDWKPEEQTKRASARDADGEITSCNSVDAVRWCAFGRMEYHGLPNDVFQKFDIWLDRHYRVGVLEANDAKGWTPSMFAAAWYEFENGPQS